MQKIDLNLLKTELDADLLARKISGRTLLDRFSVIDNDSRKTAPYLDYRYAVFYYHLGKYVKPNSVIEVGFTLGLLSCCLFTSCKTANHFLGYKENGPDYVPLRLGKRNIRSVFKKDANFYVGRLHDQKFEDIIPKDNSLVIYNVEEGYDQHREYFEFLWGKLPENSLFVAEYIKKHKPAGDAFFDFCQSVNREPIIFSTRYGTGVMQK